MIVLLMMNFIHDQVGNNQDFFQSAFLWDDPDQDQWSEITWIMVDQNNEPMNPLWTRFDLP